MAGVHAMMISGGGGGGVTVDAIYLKPNGVTIAAIPNAAKGAWHSFEGKDYYVAIDYDDLVSVVSVYKSLSGDGEVLAKLTRDGQTKSVPLNQVVTTFVEQFGTDAETDGLFYNAGTFNQLLSRWDVSNVTNMQFMFYLSRAFVQDISGWCVSKIKDRPSNFDTNTSATWTAAMKPKWGAPCS